MVSKQFLIVLLHKILNQLLHEPFYSFILGSGRRDSVLTLACLPFHFIVIYCTKGCVFLSDLPGYSVPTITYYFADVALSVCITTECILPLTAGIHRRCYCLPKYALRAMVIFSTCTQECTGRDYTGCFHWILKRHTWPK